MATQEGMGYIAFLLSFVFRGPRRWQLLWSDFFHTRATNTARVRYQLYPYGGSKGGSRGVATIIFSPQPCPHMGS